MSGSGAASYGWDGGGTAVVVASVLTCACAQEDGILFAHYRRIMPPRRTAAAPR